MQIPYEFLGKIFIFMLLLALLGTGLALLIGAYSFKKHRIIFPGLRIIHIVSFLFSCKMDLQSFPDKGHPC